jgi:hypothetical protein
MGDRPVGDCARNALRARSVTMGVLQLAEMIAGAGREVRSGGKSELRRAVRRVTPGQGDLKESGTENIPLAGARGRKAEGDGE